MRSSVVVAVLAVVLATRVAAAQPAPGEEDKSPELAVTLSLVGTLGPLALLESAPNERTDGERKAMYYAAALTFVLGPTTGHWYAGEAWTSSTSVRVAGIGVATIALVGASSSTGDTSAALGVAVLGIGVATGAAIYDVATAGDAVRRWNHSHVHPTALRMRGGGYGVGLAGSF